MQEARDRTESPVDYAAIFAINRRHHGVLLDEAASRFGAFEHPIQRLPSGSRVYAQPESLLGGNYSSWRPDSGNESGYSPFRREKLSWSRRGKDGALRSLLPSWYTRTPLRDITHIIRVSETPTKQQVYVLDTPVAASADEHNFVMVTHALAVGLKRMFPASTARLHKMVLDYIKKEISAGEEEEAEFITSEKKLLNSIEMVEKIVMDEIQKMQSTPLAKREERKKKVKCLVVMQRFTLKKK
ncbi:protein GIGAS CELL1-like [Brassica napus]|uniref:protein GIGAS CELL1-like n=1 Tax=Brassica napus TaxID=3708 RepID=UPI002079F801|nr:protein GIGAS CELL1-like [Brassica napus]